MAKSKKPKVIKRVTTPNYVVEDYKNPPAKDVVAYRRKKVGDHLVNGGKQNAGSLYSASVSE